MNETMQAHVVTAAIASMIRNSFTFFNLEILKLCFASNAHPE
jgi:hypothetical protein